jgi:hypothetical protein
MKSHRGRSDKKQVVVMDAGIATNDNLKILKEESFDYICVSRGKLKEYRATSLSPVKYGINPTSSSRSVR